MNTVFLDHAMSFGLWIVIKASILLGAVSPAPGRDASANVRRDATCRVVARDGRHVLLPISRLLFPSGRSSLARQRQRQIRPRCSGLPRDRKNWPTLRPVTVPLSVSPIRRRTRFWADRDCQRLHSRSGHPPDVCRDTTATRPAARQCGNRRTGSRMDATVERVRGARGRAAVRATRQRPRTDHADGLRNTPPDNRDSCHRRHVAR